MNEWLEMWKHYCDFHGRTTVRGYWMAFLVNVVVALLLNIIVFATGSVLLYVLSGVYVCAGLLPGLGLCVRRLKDAGKEWYWIFVALIPVAGLIWMLILLCSPSVEPQNSEAHV